MSALAITASFFHQPRIEFRPDGVYVCGEPLRPADKAREQLSSAQDLERHAGHAAASPWSSAKTMPSAERLDQMATSPHPLPPRERPPIGRPGLPPPPPTSPFSALLRAVEALAPAHSAMKQRLDSLQDQAARQAERATEQAHEGVAPGRALLNAFGVDTARERVSFQLQTMLGEYQRSEDAAASIESRLGDQRAEIAKRV